MEEDGTLVFQFAKDKGYKDKAFFNRLENGKLIEGKSSYIVDFSGFCTIFAPT